LKISTISNGSVTDLGAASSPAPHERLLGAVTGSSVIAEKSMDGVWTSTMGNELRKHLRVHQPGTPTISKTA
jgi:hypothetical protein